MTAAKPRERGIACSGDEVRGLLDGRVSLLVRPIDFAKLRVHLPARVTSDPAWGLIHQPIIAEPGRYRAAMNRHGAVSIDVHGEMLGVRPGEFHFVCPFLFGETVNTSTTKGRAPWTIVAQSSERRFVRETWAIRADITGLDGVLVAYRADSDTPRWKHVSRPPMTPWIAGEVHDHRWRSATQMPRWVSRLSVDITDVRILRVQDMSADDALAAGVVSVPFRPDDGFPVCVGYMRGEDDGSTSLEPTAISAFMKHWRAARGDVDWAWGIGVKVAEVRA